MLLGSVAVIDLVELGAAIIRSPRTLIAIGCLLVGLALLWFGQLTVESTYLKLLLPAMVVMAVGLALIFVPITLTAVAGVEPHDAGIASALLNVSQQIGGTLGLSILVTVFATGVKNFLSSGPVGSSAHAIQLAALAHGWATAFRFAAIFAAVGLVVSMLGLQVKPSQIAQQQPAPVA